MVDSDQSAPLWFVGQHETARTQRVTPELLGQAQDHGYDMVTSPITTTDFQARVLALLQQHGFGESKEDVQRQTTTPLISPLTPKDTDLTPYASNSALVAVSSTWIDLGSPDPIIANISRQVFNLEIAYAAFCGITHILISGPVPGSDTAQYARAIQEALGLGPYIQINVHMPMTGELEQADDDSTHLGELVREEYMADPEDDDESENAFAVWESWDAIRTICNYSSRLSIALEIPRQLPSPRLQSRWYSEPVRVLVFPRISFLKNAKGFPVLHKQHQQYLNSLVRLRFPPWMLLSDVGAIEAQAEEETIAADPTPAQSKTHKPKDPVPYLRYMRHLQQTQAARPPIERFGQGYQDYMQSPLQPLTDNLESITYEVFEKDPVKYDWYEKAIALALKDLRAKLEPQRKITVAVVGSGRGPLVSKALLASHSSGIEIQCWAVEKNPNAYVHLQRRNATDKLWNNQVTVVKTDMRAWKGPVINNQTEKVDILVSELLGSFADNELSPECLDGVQHVLHPDHGINIPQSYTAHFTPISTPRLYNDLLSRSDKDKWGTPFVVMLQQYDYLSLDSSNAALPHIHEAWEFSHPISEEVLLQAKNRAGGSAEHGGAGGAVGGDGSNEHNARFCKARFRVQDQGVCHGLGGYFESVLYASANGKKVEISTNPNTIDAKSKDMISWFPIFFPLKTPISLPANSELAVTMWRQTDDRKVWYEWCVEASSMTGNKRARIGMSELHSSRTNGCLM